ncbi:MULTISPECIES: NAD-dependent epimerase/dehydratase family protein [Silvimonas]|uniref:NAD-dependent epimerase/dehydratase family protein n=1 Tax=Silvimonas TaxID=300264 RepID=UPI0024B383D4|nr:MULTISPECIES: NAD-dependent epimerase/dehydratase family protein [Silvimonas]MDR3429954.1 hypothetical protein [Silvimonas sp.]
MSTLLLTGATGLVGHAVLRQALADERVSRVVAPTRRALPPHPKLENPVIDFDQLPKDAPWWQVDAVICTLGTTLRVAGSREAFRKVDLEYPLRIALLARRHGARMYALNSAMGAKLGSRVFYLKVKGELEQSLMECDYPSVLIVRPGLLGGDRTEIRPGERFGQVVLGALNGIMPRRFRIVPAEKVARALLEGALAATPGLEILESEDLL